MESSSSKKQKIVTTLLPVYVVKTHETPKWSKKTAEKEQTRGEKEIRRKLNTLVYEKRLNVLGGGVFSSTGGYYGGTTRCIGLFLHVLCFHKRMLKKYVFILRIRVNMRSFHGWICVMLAALS